MEERERSEGEAEGREQREERREEREVGDITLVRKRKKKGILQRGSCVLLCYIMLPGMLLLLYNATRDDYPKNNLLA
jgi:hypothetical protein